MRGEIVVATEADARAVTEHLRTLDCQELRRRLGLSLEAYVARSLARSTHAWAGRVNGRTICVFGLMAPTLVSLTATAWLFTTPDVDRHRREFWKGSREMVQRMLDLYPRIEGCVDERFVVSVQWLKRLGFVLGDSFDYEGLPFRPFALERKP